MRFLGSMLAALKNALVAVMSMGLYAMAWPFRTLAGFMNPQGRSAVPSPQERFKLDVEKEVAAQSISASQKRGPMAPMLTAAAAVSWAAARVTGVGGRSLPDDIPVDVKTWALNLSPRELLAVAKAGPARLIEHLNGRQPIAGLPPVKPAAVKQVSPLVEESLRITRRRADEAYRLGSKAPKRARPEEPPALRIAL